MTTSLMKNSLKQSMMMAKSLTELSEKINEKLKSNSYDGPNDSYVMYWFAKGLKLPEPKVPKHYIDSDIYFFNHLHKFKFMIK